MRRPIVILFAVAFVAAFTAQAAFAYLNPGTGSMILQLLLGGIAGALVVLKLYWESITSLFRRKRDEKTNRRPQDVNLK